MDFIAGVTGQIFTGYELCRIHEDRYHDPVALCARRPDQRQMSLMQVAHRWYESQTLPRVSGRCAQSIPIGYGANDLHRVLSELISLNTAGMGYDLVE